MAASRRLLWRAGFAAQACALLLSAAAPVAGPPIADWSNIETVLVTAKRPGPALWHVVRGQSEVWILPTVEPSPSDLKWDTSEVARMLKGAKVLLLPPRAQVGLFEGTWFLLTGLSTLELPQGTTLEGSLPDSVKGRFLTARVQLHEDADRYEKYLPAVAAVILESDFWKANDLKFNGAQKTVERLAAQALVPAHTIAVYSALDVIHDVPKLSPAANLICLEDALNDIETESVHAASAARAWTVGDLNGVKAHYSETKIDSCLQQSGVYSALRDKEIFDVANAIAGVLDKPGKSFAVMPSVSGCARAV
jgi:TraB/PrgY/gumN family